MEADAPVGYWCTQTFIAGLRVDDLAAPWLPVSPMNRAAFDAHNETQLAPALEPGDVVIADNLAAPKSAHVQERLHTQGNWMLFLPPYSPDLNPIEMAFSKLKPHLRRMAVPTFDVLTEAVGSICDLYPPEECKAYFSAANYVSDQLSGALDAGEGVSKRLVMRFRKRIAPVATPVGKWKSSRLLPVHAPL